MAMQPLSLFFKLSQYLGTSNGKVKDKAQIDMLVLLQTYEALITNKISS